MVPIGTPLQKLSLLATLGWPGGTEGLVESVLRISPSTNSTGVSIVLKVEHVVGAHERSRNRLNGGQGQNKIVSTHLHHVRIAIHT